RRASRVPPPTAEHELSGPRALSRGRQPAAARFRGPAAAFLAGAAFRAGPFLPEAFPPDDVRDPETRGVFFLAASTDAFRASIRSTTRAGATSGTASISSPAIFFSTTSRRPSRYSSRYASGFQGPVRLSMSDLAISTSLERTLASASS